jgi:TusA-related sulfurtransferase
MDKEAVASSNSAHDNKSCALADVTLDLKGKQCPMTFVYTKLGLEKMQPGQVLKVILDYIPSFTNVPRSIELQHLGEVINEQQDGEDNKTLWIRKR